MDTKILNAIDNIKNRKTGEPITNTTKTNYKNMYNSLKKIDNNFFTKLLELQDNKKEFNKMLKKVADQVFIENPQKKINRARSKGYFLFISQIISLIPELKEKLTDYGNTRIRDYVKETFKEQQELQDDKVDFENLKIKWSDYIKKVKEITDDDNVDLNDKILFNLYRFIPIRDNFGKVVLTDKTKIFHLNNYKTKSNYGSKQFKVPDFIAEMIKTRYDDGYKYMISKDKETLYGNGVLKQYIQRATKKLFGFSFGVNDIRKSIINSYENKSIKSKRELADRMLNSYNTQQGVYVRNERN